jgi:antitoxin component YwqK of YwqJK toxin-antitoxin module
MKLKLFTLLCFVVLSGSAKCQTDTLINQTDSQGRKQGHWIKKYPNENVMYDGYFKDDHPVGELKRYYENKTLKSVLIYSDDGRKAEAAIYHENGNISSKGTYINQMKEGKWLFFSETITNCIISEDYFSKNLRNGLSVRYYPDSTKAEQVMYVNGIKQGAWFLYYPSGKILLKSGYLNGKINGPFEVWYENGAIEFSGQYKNDSKEGQWIIFNKDGSIKYKLEYLLGFPSSSQMDIDETEFLDSLESNKGKISDPEKTGIVK